MSCEDEWLAKGGPFTIARLEGVEELAEIGLFPLGVAPAQDEDGGWYPIVEDMPPRLMSDGTVLESLGEDARGVFSVKAYFDDDGCYCCDILDGKGGFLPYDAWNGDEQGLLLDLTERYGERLRLVVARPPGIMGKAKVIAIRT